MAALPCTASKGTEPSERIRLFPRSLCSGYRCAPPQQILGQGCGPASRPVSSWDTGHCTEPVLKWGPRSTRVWAGRQACDLCPLPSGTSPLPLPPTTGPLGTTRLRGRRRGGPTEAGLQVALPAHWPLRGLYVSPLPPVGALHRPSRSSPLPRGFPGSHPTLNRGWGERALSPSSWEPPVPWAWLGLRRHRRAEPRPHTWLSLAFLICAAERP